MVVVRIGAHAPGYITEWVLILASLPVAADDVLLSGLWRPVGVHGSLLAVVGSFILHHRALQDLDSLGGSTPS